MGLLDVLDHVASIATAVVAVYAYGRYAWGRRCRRLTLEAYLKKERPGGRFGMDTGARTILRVMADLRLSEREIFDAAFTSDKVEILSAPNPITGRTSELLLQHRSSAR